MSTSNPTPEEADLDFTKQGGEPPPPPEPETVAQAEAEAPHVAPQLENAGFYVSIARHAERTVPPRNGKQYVILVVEDDGDLAQLIFDIFMTAGYELRWASNRAEINREMKRAAEIDLVLLDIVLPDANGLQVLGRIRQHPTIKALPVILMTGKSTTEDVLAGLAAGADGYVSKPFQISGLLKAVKQVLGTTG
jgi:two-component system, OmpR family, response regulator